MSDERLRRAGSSFPTGAREALSRPSQRAERRIRLGRALEALTTVACFALFAAAVVLVLRKTGHLREDLSRVALAGALLSTVVAAVVGYFRPLASRAGAVALDRYHGLKGRMSSALAFLDSPSSERTPFMDLAIVDGVAAARGADPRRAVPFRAPKDLAAALGLLVATVGIALFEVREHRPIAAAKTIEAVDVTADDLDAMREFLRAEGEKNQSEETRAVTLEFNQLIEDLAQRRLDRTEVFRRMQALEDKLLEGRAADRKALEDALQKIGEELQKADLTRPAGEALDTKNLSNASDALKKLAEKLREKGSSIDKAELQKMRDALKRAAEDNASRQQTIAQRREELEKQLLHDKQRQAEKDGGTDEERSLLQKKERELERLSREDEEKQAAGRQLDRLDRELAQAAEDLMKDLGQSSKDLDQGAEDINRMAREEMSEQEKQELKEKIDELREMLRQQGQGGQQQMVRLRRFQSRARGQQGGQGGQQGQGQPGQPGQEGEGQEGQEGQNGQGQQGQQGQGQQGQGQQGQGQQGQGQQGQNGQRQGGNAPGGGGAGQGQRGQGQGQGQGQGGEVWVLGPNGEKILMLSQGGSGSGQGSGQNGGSGSGDGHGSKNWGTGHDEHVEGAATSSKGGTIDSQIEGQDTGQGASRSEVIQGAAERGFASHGYTKVYREYHAVAEEALGKDEIPGGYRFYVKRYFQLIRPRE